jgi:hypothetical protein
MIRVPITTDIEDRSFVDAFRRGLENVWRFQDAVDEFQVALDVRFLTPSELHRNRLRPARVSPSTWVGISRGFGARPILTAGAPLTRVSGRLAINLGPADISRRVLAHELGHILGFADGYFRGCRDRRRDGYEVLEIVTDPEDIMSASGFGRAQRHHFEALLRSFGATGPASSGSGRLSAREPAPHGRPAK